MTNPNRVLPTLKDDPEFFEALRARFKWTPHTPESSKAAKEAFEAQNPMLKGMDWNAFAEEVKKDLS